MGHVRVGMLKLLVFSAFISSLVGLDQAGMERYATTKETKGSYDDQ